MNVRIPKAGDYVQHIETGEKLMVLWAFEENGTVIVKEDFSSFSDSPDITEWDRSEYVFSDTLLRPGECMVLDEEE